MDDARNVEIHAVTAERWPDLVDLFERPGPRGAWPRTSTCYCMFWRLAPAEYEAAFRQRSLENRRGGPNKEAMEAIVADGREPGLLAYRDGASVGWVAVAPRSELARLGHSAGLRTDEAEAPTAWSISCFYVHRAVWRQGVGSALLAAAITRARARGATTVEGYPVRSGSVDPYTGFDTMFAKAGFQLARPGKGRGRALWRRSFA